MMVNGVFPFPFCQSQIKPTKRTIRKAFTREEDAKLVEIVNSMADHFTGWHDVAEQMKTRSPRQCRERWFSYLSPDIRVEKWTPDEDQFLIKLVEQLGTKWSKIAVHFNGRSNSDVKNRWYFHLKDIASINCAGQIVISPENQTKKKRQRKIVCAYEEALKTIEKQNNVTNPTTITPVSPPVLEEPREEIHHLEPVIQKPHTQPQPFTPIIAFPLERSYAKSPQNCCVNQMSPQICYSAVDQIPTCVTNISYEDNPRITFPPISQLIEQNGLDHILL